MSNEIVKVSKIEEALVMGNLAALSADERMEYYKRVCESVGLNPLTKPLEYIALSGKLTLYATKNAAEQLRSIHKISLSIVSRETIEGVYVVTARATDKTGRFDEATGAIPLAGLKGEALANAFMKAETKSKRRVTLSICGLGMLDETEVESIPGAVVQAPAITATVAPTKALAAAPAKTPREQAIELIKTRLLVDESVAGAYCGDAQNPSALEIDAIIADLKKHGLRLGTVTPAALLEKIFPAGGDEVPF